MPSTRANTYSSSSASDVSTSDSASQLSEVEMERGRVRRTDSVRDSRRARSSERVLDQRRVEHQPSQPRERPQPRQQPLPEDVEHLPGSAAYNAERNALYRALELDSLRPAERAIAVESLMRQDAQILERFQTFEDDVINGHFTIAIKTRGGMEFNFGQNQRRR
ncbi:Oidioi.mRNA.OKI2018_I69.chr2.g5902.t1.cds [Oikopleura dioica]|uniref:Oidioi.mRNA.OKI2018_I69.chr2.g5902.t1.cds n=1 Tax=Oikopleura dioica TaxID=34765 RepID=A0ABN7T4Z0_OIKDI|nr:Oidioi.mRNA.OKI2018_I69.chr2.g5902.t1.cds [Oikopleura dioica]